MTRFPTETLPYGVFSTPGTAPRVGVAVGDQVLDLTTVQVDVPESTFAASSLNRFLALARPRWTSVRSAVAELVADGAGTYVPQSEVILHMPVEVGDFVDFYSSINHATNVGRLFRPDSDSHAGHAACESTVRRLSAPNRRTARSRRRAAR